MKKLRFKEPYNHNFYQGDIDRIVKIFADRGYEISESDAVRGWREFSSCYAAGWMSLGEDEEVFLDCFCYFEEVE